MFISGGAYHYFSFWLQKLLWVAMVKSVSAKCVSMVPNRVNSSSVNLQASVLAMAVIEAVSSHEFTRDSPRVSFYDETDGICVVGAVTGYRYQQHIRAVSRIEQTLDFGHILPEIHLSENGCGAASAAYPTT